MIHRFDTIDSTNNRAKDMAQQGAPHGTVLIARHQTGGRGRLGRSFHSPPGSGIYLSMILRPSCRPDKLMHLTCAAAVAMCDAIQAATGFRPGIKWTNDLVWSKRKLGGILTELGFDGADLSYAVVGVGINCTQSSEDFPPELKDMAASLSMATEKAVDMTRLEEEMIRALDHMSACLLTEKGSVLQRYRTDCVTLGKEISVVCGDLIRHGKALDVDDDGGLTVIFADGSTETVAFGEVSIRGMYGYL